MQIDTYETIAIVVLLVLSISVHEWAHAAATTFLGDSTAKDRGRLTLNPTSHADPVWTLLIPFLGLQFGGFFVAAGKPVPYNPGQWNQRLWGRRLQRKWGEFLVALAGPASNLAQALIGALILAALIAWGGLESGDISRGLRGLDTANPAVAAVWGIERFIFINALLAVFNLMPIAPLDGEKVVAPFLPAAWANRLAHLGPWGFLILLLIVIRLPWVINTPIHWLHQLCMQLALTPLSTL